MIGIVIRILYWCTLIKPSLAVDASLANITLIVKDYWSKFQRQKKSLKKGPSSRTLLAIVGKQTPFGYFATSERTHENISRTLVHVNRVHEKIASAGYSGRLI